MKKIIDIKKSKLYSEVDYSAVLSCLKLMSVQFKYYEFGEIDVRLNTVCLFDPYSFSAFKPFHFSFPNGNFPVYALTVSTSQGERIAFSGIKFTDKAAKEWKLALFDDKDIFKLSVGKERIVTLIHSGLAAYASFPTVKEYEALVKANKRDFHILDSKLSLDGCTYDTFKTDQGIMSFFSSGWGDGAYETFIGLDENGEVCGLITDYEIVDHPKKKDDGITVSFEFDLSVEELYQQNPRLSDEENMVAKYTLVIKHEAEVSKNVIFNAYSRRGYALHSLGKLSEALSDYLAALALGKELSVNANFKFHAWTLYDNIGAIYRERGQYNLAIEIFTQAKEVQDSFYSGVYINLVEIYLLEKNYIKALEIAEEMVKTRKDDPNSYNKRLEVLLATEEYERAILDLDILIYTFKMNEMIIDKVSCLAFLNRIDEALIVLEDYLIDGKANEVYYFTKANLYYKNKNYCLAHSNLLKCYDTNPDYLPCIEMLIEIDMLALNYINVIKWTRKFIELRPSNKYGYHERARANFELGNYATAFADYEFIYNNIDQDLQYVSLLIKCALKENNIFGAKKYLKVLRKQEAAYSINGMAKFLQKKQRYAKAERYFLSAYKILNSEMFLSDLIDCQLEAKFYEKANSCINQLIASFSDSNEGYLKSAKLLTQIKRGDKLANLRLEYINKFLGETRDPLFLICLNRFFSI